MSSNSWGLPQVFELLESHFGTIGARTDNTLVVAWPEILLDHTDWSLCTCRETGWKFGAAKVEVAESMSRTAPSSLPWTFCVAKPFPILLVDKAGGPSVRPFYLSVHILGRWLVLVSWQRMRSLGMLLVFPMKGVRRVSPWWKKEAKTSSALQTQKIRFWRHVWNSPLEWTPDETFTCEEEGFCRARITWTLVKGWAAVICLIFCGLLMSGENGSAFRISWQASKSSLFTALSLTFILVQLAIAPASETVGWKVTVEAERSVGMASQIPPVSVLEGCETNLHIQLQMWRSNRCARIICHKLMNCISFVHGFLRKWA